jgi:hypothetical protein
VPYSAARRSAFVSDGLALGSSPCLLQHAHPPLLQASAGFCWLARALRPTPSGWPQEPAPAHRRLLFLCAFSRCFTTSSLTSFFLNLILSQTLAQPFGARLVNHNAHTRLRQPANTIPTPIPRNASVCTGAELVASLFFLLSLVRESARERERERERESRNTGVGPSCGRFCRYVREAPRTDNQRRHKPVCRPPYLLAYTTSTIATSTLAPSIACSGRPRSFRAKPSLSLPARRL